MNSQERPDDLMSHDASIETSSRPSLEQLREKYRQEGGEGARKLGEFLKRAGGAALDTIATIRTLPEMVRRTPEKMREIGDQVNTARQDAQAFVGNKTREGLALGRASVIEARKKVTEFAAENWHFSKRNIERRRLAAEQAANMARFNALSRETRELEEAQQHIDKRKLEIVEEKMRLLELLMSAAEVRETDATQPLAA